ncbi:conserved protein of unknown function [Paraburkholderia dioscoreae]|uniref:Histidine kinase-, DNA gyrase B-, and HSP90-like ATPase n=2 Tax=Paraburkholderia dioscoreae TaxID=2604047 RepID=A0A5Q4YTI3_9BURK|nr:conserved protein of unknown function [Paraburkholderia dioscoreae]
MPTGIKPRVNEAREFLEIAKDFKDPKEILREALSNCWDAGASKATIKFSLLPCPGSKRKKIRVEIIDNGDGMSADPRGDGKPSEVESFFNLGDSYKHYGSIGSKGHGTKIYYKSLGITLDSWKDGHRVHAETEVPPWEELLRGKVPTYRYEKTLEAGQGTHIVVDGFQAKHNEFSSLDELIPYLRWFTVLGSFGQYFNSPRRMDVALKPLESSSPVTLPYGFEFPPEQTDLAQGADSICKLFGPKRILCGVTEEGNEVYVDIIGALLGENHRGIVPHTYTHMGLWLCKDYIRVERSNEILEAVLKGQYYYRSLLIFANCQQFDLTANRNNVRTEQEYDLAIEGIKTFCAELWKDEFVEAFFASKKNDEETKRDEEKAREHAERQAKWQQTRKERLNLYKGRANLPTASVKRAPVKEPRNEAETGLLLQAMISSGHPGVDFVIGEYNATNGVDLIIEQTDKDMDMLKWAELVYSLDRLYQWPHPPEGYHCIICYQLGAVKEVQDFLDGQTGKLVPKSVKGKYTLLVGSDSIDIYVLRELLIAAASKPM